jgi:rhodanese-related sulfurtransferase
MKEMTAQEAHDAWARGEVNIVDVREAHEFETTHVDGMPLVPMSKIADSLDDLPSGKTLVVMCRSGGRSAKVIDFLASQGRDDDLVNLEGGILAWAAAGMPYEGVTPT